MLNKLTSINLQLNNFLSSSRRISIGMGVLRILRSFFSIITVVLSSNYFGVSIERDAWVIGGTLVASISGLLFGPITNIFRTMFISIREEKGEISAIKSTSDLIGGIFLISILIILLIELFPSSVARFVAPGFSNDGANTVIMMIRLLIPSLLINQLIIIWTSVLNSYNSFLIPDVFAFFSSILNIVLIVALTPIIDINSLIVSNYISTIILSIILLRELKKKEVLLYNFSFSWKSVKPYLVFSLPLYFSFFSGQFLSIMERRLCTYLGPGTVSSFDYSKRFIDLTLNVILSIVPMVLTPILANLFVKKMYIEFGKELIQNIRMFMIGIIPIVILFTICSQDLVKLLLVQGKFDSSFIPVISNSMFWLGIGMIGVVLYVVSGEALVAQKKIKLLTFLSSASYLIIVLIDLFFYKKYGAPLFAFSWAIVHLILGIAIYFSLLRSDVLSKKLILSEFFRILLIYLVVFSLAFLNNLIFGNTLDKSMIILKLFVISTTSILAIILLVFILKLEERNLLKRLFKGILK